MTDSEVAELLADCPTLYHMAERGSWPSIRERGLESTTALLDRYKVTGQARAKIEAERRPAGVPLERHGLGRAMVRDQLPLTDEGLVRCLEDGLSPEDWYRTLNAKVFFWLTRERLLKLLNAGSYRLQEHDVLSLDTKLMLEAYREEVWLCPMNSGATNRFVHRRGKQTFRRIADYPYAQWREKRKRGERVVEFAVDYAVRDIERFVTRVVRMRGDDEQAILFQG